MPTRCLYNGVAKAHHVGVVSGPTSQDICRTVSSQNIIQRIAGTIDGGASGEGQIFQVRTQRIGFRLLYTVSIPDRLIPSRCRYIVDHKHIISGTTGHAICASASIKRVIACAS